MCIPFSICIVVFKDTLTGYKSNDMSELKLHTVCEGEICHGVTIQWHSPEIIYGGVYQVFT